MPPLEGRWHGAAVTERCCRRTGLRRSDWVRRHLSVGFADSSPQGAVSYTHLMVHRDFAFSRLIVAVNPLVDTQHRRNFLLLQVVIFPQVF